ncbi:MAG: aspartate-semialdehyde dehydrogenase [Clostridiales bacterium]|nr:aspartate-semialdehyde dehydrogenase [Clostridiales bacterium]
MEKKYRVGIIGATGMVGQRFVQLLSNHPWFHITALAASASSAGKTYRQAVGSRWAMEEEIPEAIGTMTVLDAQEISTIGKLVDFVFCAVSMDKEQTRILEEAYAKAEIPVVSNNSACRGLEDVPMLIPEINHHHVQVINAQKNRLGTKRGFIAVKPNCSIQSYVPPLSALWEYGVKAIQVCTYQAISGAGKTFETWPEMVDNVIPYIGGEDEKSEQEPLKVWGELVETKQGTIVKNAQIPSISAQCIRVPAKDGHLAAVSVSFERKPTMEEVLEKWENYETLPKRLGLPSAPQEFIHYFTQADRPQTRLDRDFEKGMGITMGRLREDANFDYKFVCLSHNTLRGAAGGAVLMAELLCALDYIMPIEQ